MTYRNEARRVIANKRTGWWRVWTQDTGRHTIDGMSMRSQHVNAPTRAAAIKQIQGTLSSTETVTAVEPIGNPNRPEHVAFNLIADANDYLKDNLAFEIECISEGAPFENQSYFRDILPPRFAAAYTAELLERFLGTLNQVAGKLVRFPRMYLASTAEELAAHALLNQAEAEIDCDFDLFAPEERKYSDQMYADARHELDAMHQDAFEDWDVLMLWDDDLAGLENPNHPVSLWAGFANLAVADWWTPFREDEQDAAGDLDLAA